PPTARSRSTFSPREPPSSSSPSPVPPARTRLRLERQRSAKCEDCVISQPTIAKRYLICLQNLHRLLILVECNMETQEHVSQGLEIKRKFLVFDKPAFLKSCDRKRIRQGYLVVGQNGTEVRVRQEGKRYFLTIKTGHGKARVEEELRIDRKGFD